MKVHHLNCGSMRMPTAPLVCHVLLVETDNGLVLIDTGFGLQDCARPAERIGGFRHVIRPVLRPHETAAHQIDALGFRRNDVRHIVLTHFDLDHIGGLSDFPHAAVHVTAAEARGAVHNPNFRERVRYRRSQWAHDPKLVEHEPDGEPWRGFAAARELRDISPGIALVALAGHTRGHAAVAVDAGHRWVLHAGDAFYHPGTLTADGAGVPRVLKAQESVFAFDREQLRANQTRLAELYRRNDPDLLVVCSHDPTLYEQARSSA